MSQPPLTNSTTRKSETLALAAAARAEPNGTIVAAAPDSNRERRVIGVMGVSLSERSGTRVGAARQGRRHRGRRDLDDRPGGGTADQVEIGAGIGEEDRD